MGGGVLLGACSSGYSISVLSQDIVALQYIKAVETK